MMKVSSIAVVLAVGTASAGPVPPPTPVRKPIPEGMTAEVIAPFVDAILLDKHGDLDEAIRKYEDANRIAPAANTYYNLADLDRRIERYDDAIAAYAKYLELAPAAATASDRAAVATIIDQLKHADHIVTLDGKEPDAVILMDGKVLGPSPQVIRIPTGETHVFERISPAGYAESLYEAKYDLHHHENLSAHDLGGNVVLSKSAAFGTSGAWDDAVTKQRFSLAGRQTLAPGHYTTQPWNDPKLLCAPLGFDVPRTLAPTEVLHVYIDAQPKPADHGCQKATIRTQIVKLPR